MSQEIFDDIDPSSTSGTQLATLLNEFKDAYASGNSGDTSRPANLQANGSWIKYNDPDNGLLTWYLYDGTQDIELFQINKSTANIILSNSEDEFNIIKNSDDALGPEVNLKKGRIAGGGQTMLNDVVGNIKWVGRDGSAVEYTQAQVTTVALEDVTSGAHGAEVAFYVTQTGTSSLVKAVTITNDKKLGVGVTNPTQMVEAYAEDSTAGFKATISEDSTTGASMTVRKKRVTGSGQVLLGDTVGNFESKSTDNAGAEIDSANIKAVAAENHTATAGGTTLVIQRVKTGETALTDIITIAEDLITLDDNVTVTGDLTASAGSTTTVEELQVNQDLTVTGDLTVNGTTTSIDTANLVVEDNNIVINSGGNDASSEGAGLTIERTATDGSIVYEDALASKFKVGALGSEKELVNVDSAQDVENKAIITPSRLDVKQGTEAALETYALTADDGQFVFATDSQKMYQILDNALADVGGGGAGSLSTYGTVQGDNDDLDSFTDSLTNAVLAFETTTPISGDQSYKVTISTGASGTLTSKEVDVLPRSNSKVNSQKFQYKYDGDDSDLSAKMQYYNGSWADVEGSELELEAATSVLPAIPNGFMPSDATKTRWVFTIDTANNGKVFHFNDIVFSDDPFTYKNLTVRQTVRYDLYAGMGSTNTFIPYFSNLIENTGEGIITADNSSTLGFSVTANKECTVFISSTLDMGNTNVTGFTLNSTFLSTSVTAANNDIFRLSENDAANLPKQSTIQVNMKAGDVLRNHLNATPTNDDGRGRIYVSAFAESEHVVTPAKSNLTDWEDYTPTITGFGTPTSVNFRYRRVGDSVEIQGRFTSGTPTAVEAQFGLPSGLTIDSNAGSNKITGAADHNIASTSVARFMNVLATAGDTYLNMGWRDGSSSVNDSLAPQLANSLISSGISISFSATVPIEGWSSNATFLAAIPVPKTAYIYEDLTPGTNGGSTLTNGVTTRGMDTVKGDTEIVVVNTSDQFRFTKKGKHKIKLKGTANRCDTHMVYLYNATQAAYDRDVVSVTGYSSSVAHNWAQAEGTITVTSTDDWYEMRHYTQTVQATNGFGIEGLITNNPLVSDVYAIVQVEQLQGK